MKRKKKLLAIYVEKKTTLCIVMPRGGARPLQPGTPACVSMCQHTLAIYVRPDTRVYIWYMCPHTTRITGQPPAAHPY